MQYNSRADYLDRVLYYSTWPVYFQKRTGENNCALHFIFIELERFKKEEGELKDQLEGFLFYLKNMGRLQSVPKRISFKPVDALVRAAEVASLSDRAREEYDANMRNAFDIRTEKIYEREEGRKEGLAEGKAQNQQEIAKVMLLDGIDASVVAKYTGLSVEQVKSLAP